MAPLGLQKRICKKIKQASNNFLIFDSLALHNFSYEKNIRLT